MAKPDSKYTLSFRVLMTKDGVEELPMYDSGDMKWQGVNYAGATMMQGELIEVLQTFNLWGETLASGLSPEQAEQVQVLKGLRAKRERRKAKR